MLKKKSSLFLLLGLFFAISSSAQIHIDLSDVEINSQKVDIQGITIINDKLWIDNESIPRGKKTHKSSRTGKVYKIEWGADNNINVSEVAK